MNNTLKKALRQAVILLSKFEPTRRYASKLATNVASSSTSPRPRAFSLWSAVDRPDTLPPDGYGIADPVGDYTTWPMLSNKRYSKRYLAPAPQHYTDLLPPITPWADNRPLDAVTELFLRKSEMRVGRSTCLFMFFAQWFTDSVLRIDNTDRRKNTSNHNIDLCQIYGRTEAAARILRGDAPDGKLHCRTGADGEAYLDFLGEVVDGHWQVKTRYRGLPYTRPDVVNRVFADWEATRRPYIYATGLERGNSSLGYIALSTLFLREHNRICDVLKAAYPNWDGERLFQTARMINTVIEMKLVIEEYINHIAGRKLFIFDNRYAEQQNWYREPWVAVEFDLLYRWHSLIPDQLAINGTAYGQQDYRGNNKLLEEAGLGAVIAGASASPAGAIGLANVPAFMMAAENAMLRMGRDFRLQSYNSYRREFGLKPLTSFRQLTDDAELRQQLQGLYGHIDRLEYIVGLFAEKWAKGRIMGELLNTMLAYDAFTQIYTNPLLSRNVYNAATFSDVGLEIIDATTCTQDLVTRNISNGEQFTARFNL